MIRSCIVPEIRCATDERTDKRKEWDIEVGTPPKNTLFFFAWYKIQRFPDMASLVTIFTQMEQTHFCMLIQIQEN